MKINNSFLLLFSILNFVSFLIGFYYLEEHGASLLDANDHTYPVINGLKENFVDNIINYGKFGENSYPLHHIIFSFINPYETGSTMFRIISCLWSIIIIIVFFKTLKNKLNLNLIQSFFITSIIFLSPYFRTSAYWGMTENTGIIFLIISIYFFNLYENKNSNKSLHLFFVCFFSALSLYSRVQNIFICLFFFLYFFSEKSSFKKKFSIISYYLILSLPGLILIFLWGGLLDEQYPGEFYSLVNFNTIPRTFLVILSLVGFYSIPFVISFTKNFKNLLIKNYKFYFFTLIVLFVFFSIFGIDILSLSEDGQISYGQGFVSRICYQLTGFQQTYLIFSALGFLVIYYFFLISKKNKILILSLLIIFSLRVHFFTEYIDPLLFILIFIFFDTNFKLEINRLKNIIVFQIFFSSILLGAILV